MADAGFVHLHVHSSYSLLEGALTIGRLADLAKAQGFTLEDLVGKSRKRGAVPIKYRDPKNPQNTWTGRGRTPRWLTAAMKGGRAKKEDFLI